MRGLRADQRRLFDRIRDTQPAPEPAIAPFDTAAVVREWLAGEPVVFEGEWRSWLEGLCRQIDVHRTIAAAYEAPWARPAAGRAAAAETVSGLAVVLLANAALAPAGDGRALKYVNSTVKLLDLRTDCPYRPALTGWSWEILDQWLVR